MKRLSQEEINQIAVTYNELKSISLKTPSKIEEFKAHQKLCIEKLKFIIIMWTYKYKKFSNHPDLEQDGFEALLGALKTYDANKGNFTWWANKYISTKIYRSANAHSTIKIPIKNIHNGKPHKVNSIPRILDINFNIEKLDQKNDINKAINALPETHQKIINMLYGFNGIKEHSVASAMDVMKVSKKQFFNILKEAKKQLKDLLK